MKTFVCPLGGNDHFWQSGVSFMEYWNFYIKSNIFNILCKVFIFYCRYPFNHELSEFIYVFISVFISFLWWVNQSFVLLSWTFRPSFGDVMHQKQKIKNILPAKNFHITLHKNLIFGRNHATYQFKLYHIHFHQYLRLH